MLKNFFHLVFVFSLMVSCLTGQSSWAETEDHNLEQGQSPANKPAAGRPQADDKEFFQRALGFMTPKFLIAASTLTNQFGEKLPQALSKAMKGDEAEITPMVAYLMGRVNNHQTDNELSKDTILKAAQAERKAEEALKPEKGDERWIAFMDRIIWGAKKKLGTPSKEEGAQKYNEEFDKAKVQVEKDNAEIIEKLNQAATGVESAKNWLYGKLDPKSILAFAEGQFRSGNEKLGTLALSFIPKPGKDFIDSFSASGPQRIYVGKTAESVAKAAKGVIDHLGGFKGATASFTPFTQAPQQQYFVDRNNKFVSGAPVAVNPNPNPPPQNPPPQPPQPPQQTPNNPPPQQSPRVRPDVASLQAFLNQPRCTSCHEKVATPQGILLGNGKVKPWVDVITRLETKAPTDMTNGEVGKELPNIIAKLKELAF